MDQTPEGIRREIDETREQMRETVLAIKQKMDFPVRVASRVLAAKKGIAAGTLVLGAVVGALVLRSRRAKKDEEQP